MVLIDAETAPIYLNTPISHRTSGLNVLGDTHDSARDYIQNYPMSEDILRIAVVFALLYCPWLTEQEQ